MYPSCFSPLKPNRNCAMDPEPDSCQRADGKKWRCSKKAVPHEKFCEGHMHRGRNRGSRKLVEAKEMIPKPDNNNHVRIMMPISSSDKSYSDIRLAQNGLGQSLPGKNKESSFENANPTNIKYGTTKNNQSGFGSSPKSVLHCGAGKTDYDTKNTIKNVPQRCKRTDGKNWQCRQDALLEEKYCQKHMHRGAKRAISNLLSPPPRKARTSCTIITSLDNSINLNTIPASPQLVSDNGSTSSSSEATTISN